MIDGRRTRTLVRRPASPARQGFSLLEALLVLLIAGMALMLVFAIGGQSARIGFRLGRRALTIADTQVAEDEWRQLVAALVIPPSGVDADALRLTPFRGAADGFEAGAILTRPGLCGPAGPSGPLRIEIERRSEGDRILCGARNAPAAILIDLSPRHAALSYSADGAAWSSEWAPPTSATRAVFLQHPQSVFVRLASEDGAVDWIGRANSGPPWLYRLAPSVSAPQ